MRHVIKLCLLLTMFMFAGEIVVLATARLTYHDVLAPYLDILPGQRIDGLTKFSCQWHTGALIDVTTDFCQFTPDQGPFSRIMVVESNEIITRTDFTVIPHRLSLGDLILCWGKPIYLVDKFPEAGTSHNLYWANQFMAFGDFGATDYSLPITYLSIEYEWKPIAGARLSCASEE